MNSSSPVTSTFILIIPKITSLCSFCLFSLKFLPQSTQFFYPQQKPHSWLGHNLFWFFTCSITLFHPLLFIRSLPVFTKLSINPTPFPPPTIHSFHWLRCIDTDSFLTDLEFSWLITHPLVLFWSPTSILSSLLNKHAPVITKLSRRQSKLGLFCFQFEGCCWSGCCIWVWVAWRHYNW